MIYFNQNQAMNFQRKQVDRHRITICQLISVENGQEVVFAQGESFCSPRDNFNKDHGRKIALKKALAISNFNKSQRKLIWSSYFNR